MKNPRSLYLLRLLEQIPSSLAVSLLLAGLTILGINNHLHQANLEKEVSTQATILTKSLQIAAKMTADLGQVERLEKALQGYKTLPGVVDVVILHPNGKPLLNGTISQISLPHEMSHPEIQAILEKARHTGTEVDEQITQHGEPRLVHILPFQSALFGQTNKPGFAISILTLQRIQQKSLQNLLISTTTTLIVALVLLSAMRSRLQKTTLQSLTQITREVANSKATGYFLASKTWSNDEMRLLAEAFNSVSQERQYAENALQQWITEFRQQQAILSRLAKQQALNPGNLQAAVEEVTEVVAATLKVERVSVWLYDLGKTCLRCLDLFEFDLAATTQSQHSTGLSLPVAVYSTYFAAIAAESRSIVAQEARTDPRTREFCDTYLASLDIQSVLNVPIRASGQTIGMLCLEQIGQIRFWTLEDEEFADSIAELVALAVEAHDRKQAETMIAASEHQFRTLISNIPGAVYRCHYDLGWTVNFISDAIYDISGYSAAEFLHMSVHSLAHIIHPQDVADVVQGVQQAIAQQTSYLLEYRIIHADGGTRWILNQGQGSFSDAGELLYLDGLMFDVSDRKAAESLNMQQSYNLEPSLSELQQTQAQLVQSEKMSSLGQMVVGVANEINSSVNFIYGNISYANSYICSLLELLSLYQEQYSQPDPSIQQKIDELDLAFAAKNLPKLVGSMQERSEQIRDIVRSLRTFSRLDEAEYKTANIHEGIDSTLMILYHRLKATSYRGEIQVIKDYGNIPTLECYPGQLNQVFMNLLSNTIDVLDNCDRHYDLKNSHQNSNYIHICTKQRGTHRIQIRISTNDSGVNQAISSPSITKLDSRESKLRLYTSYQVIENHAGNLFCHSTAEGTQFVIELPISGKPSSSALPKATKAQLQMT